MTTLTPEEIAAIVTEHERARTTATPIRRVTHAHPEMSIDDAYAIQRAWVDLQVAGGSTIIGHKIGLTSRAMQQAMSIGEPDFGVLLDYIVPALGADHPDEVARRNTMVQLERMIADSQILRESGVEIVPAFFHIETGEVEFGIS